MGYPTDNPMDGRGAPDNMDGGIFADGVRICIRPKRSPTGVTMGGTLARAENSATAAAIAHRCALFEPLLEAVQEAARTRQAEMEVAGLTEDDIASALAPTRALIARAEGR